MEKPDFVIKTRDSEHVELGGLVNRPVLYVVGVQDCLTKVSIKTRSVPVETKGKKTKQTREQMFFRFKNKYGSFCPKAVGKSLMLEKVDENTAEDVPDALWFEKINDNGTEHYGLKALTVPPMNLAVVGDKFVLTEDEQFVQLRLEKTKD
ncbi:uncharacterized protein ACNS7B_011075 [Menidia menidia]